MSEQHSPLYFNDEHMAFYYLEWVLWDSDPPCPHCSVRGRSARLNGIRGHPSTKNPVGAERFGLRKCYACRRQFTALIKTPLQDMHIPAAKMLRAIDLLCNREPNITGHQLSDRLGIDYKTAWRVTNLLRGPALAIGYRISCHFRKSLALAA